MNVRNIREKARELGVKNYSRIRKADLIREIQQKEGNSPCFESIPDCWEFDCIWREDCQKQEPLSATG
ncbi:MAG: Rho termination factor N-terminal domain-containing protein [Thermodesulfobacteriota bacterium]